MVSPEVRAEVKRVYRKHKITQQCEGCENDVPYGLIRFCKACLDKRVKEAKIRDGATKE